MKPFQYNVLSILSFLFCVYDSQEHDIKTIYDKSFNFLNMRNGLQLESTVVVWDEEYKACTETSNTNYNFESNLAFKDSLTAYVRSSTSRNSLRTVLSSTKSTFVLVFHLFCSMSINEAILDLSREHFVNNIFLLCVYEFEG